MAILKHYVTFGQAHEHHVEGVCLDKDCVGMFEHPEDENPRDVLFSLFGPKWCFEYNENEFNLHVNMKYFPRGVVRIPR